MRSPGRRGPDIRCLLRQHGWNADGTLLQRIDTNPVSTGTTYTRTFAYDWAKRPTSLAAASVFSGTATATYRLDGLLGTRGFPNGETVTLAYDPARRPTSASLSSTGSFSQAYDRVGNVTSEARSLSGVTGDPGTGTNSFSYDPLRRLVAETGLSSGRSYQYDLDSNRTRKVEGATTIDYTFDRTDQLINQTIAGTGTAFSYDQYGNLTQSGNSVSAVTAYTYGTASQLTSINPPGTTTDVALSLDALGRYATRVVNGVTDTYGYLGTGETVTTIVGATTRLAALDSGGSRLAAKDGTTSAYLLSDLHGNVAATERSGSRRSPTPSATTAMARPWRATRARAPWPWMPSTRAGSISAPRPTRCMTCRRGCTCRGSGPSPASTRSQARPRTR